jgi:hypothetical protein
MKFTAIRTSLIVGLLAGLAVTAINATLLKGKLTRLSHKLAAQAVALEKAEIDLANARQEASKTAIALNRTADDLKEKTRQLSIQTDQIIKLNGENKTLLTERNDAQAELSAYRVSMPSPEQVANAAKRIKSLEDSLAGVNEENVLLARSVKRLQRLIPDTVCPIVLPPDLRAKVLTVDPKWRFVVLDAGEDQGVLEHGELLISRGGRLVAKVLVSRVEKNRCVANPISGWELAELMEGDQAIPADPKL